MRLIGLSDRNKGQTPVFWVRGNSVSVNPADSCWTGELWRRQMVAELRASGKNRVWDSKIGSIFTWKCPVIYSNYPNCLLNGGGNVSNVT